MTRISRALLFGALTIILVTGACAGQETTPTVSGTLETSTPFGAPTETTGTAETETAVTATTETADGTPTVSVTDSAATSTSSTATTQTAGTGTPGTPGVPVTGADILLVECQFCVDTTAHALLVMPDTATFEIVSAPSTTTTSTSSTSVAATTPSCVTVAVNNGKQVVLCSGPEMTPLTINICTADNACTDFPVDLLACPLATQPTSAASSNTPEPGAGATNTPAAGGAATETPTITISTPTP